MSGTVTILVLAGGGIALVASGLRPRRPALAEVLDRLSRPAVEAPDARRRLDLALARPLARFGLPRPRTRQDLAICDMDPAEHLAQQLVVAIAAMAGFGVLPVLVDEDGDRLPDEGEQTGNLCIEGPWPSMMRGVYGDQDRFFATYFSQFPGYYFTGDGATRDADGYWWVTGRVDDVLNVSGHRIGSAEVESELIDRYLREIAELDTARARAASGELGICIECGQPIDFRRLEAFPAALRCTRCQALHERAYGAAAISQY